MQKKIVAIRTIKVKYVRMTKIAQNKAELLVSLRHRIQKMGEGNHSKIMRRKRFPQVKKTLSLQIRNIHKVVYIPSLSIGYPFPLFLLYIHSPHMTPML